MDPGYRIRAGHEGDVAALQAIELAAGVMVAETGLLGPRDDTPAPPRATLVAAAEAGRLWVATGADDIQVGFAMMGEVDGLAHLKELEVHPTHGRRGVGARLLETACDWAAAERYAAITLTTFRDVPYNAPFYAKHGFRVVPPADLTPAQREQMERELGESLHIEDRVFMRRNLAGG